MSDDNKITADPQRIEVTLKEQHTHAGKLCAKGDKIKILPRQKERLEKIGVV